jgi:large subunit ribosomal protein L9
MQIILQEDVEKLGNPRPSWSKSPRRLRPQLLVAPAKARCSPATDGNLKRLERMRATFAKKEATEREAAQKQADALSGVSLEVSRKAGEGDHLFGSVTSADVAEALHAKGYEIDKKKIVLVEPIKAVGEYEIPVKLHREVVAKVKLTVKKEE